MPRIEMILPGVPKQKPEDVAETYRITVERDDGIACSDMEAKTAMAMLCLQMVTGGMKKGKPRSRKRSAPNAGEITP